MPFYFYDTATGFALFKGQPNKLQLVNYQPFETMKQALDAQIAINNQELTSVYKSFIKSNFVKKFKEDTLHVPDMKLAQALKDNYDINCLCDSAALEVFREIQSNIKELIPNFDVEQQHQYQLALAHSFSRYQIQFNSESVDTMIVQSITLLDESEKEINGFMMRLQEWIVWSFPEAAKVITNHRQYAFLQTFLKGDKQQINDPETVKLLEPHFTTAQIDQLKESASISLGSDITPLDADRIKSLAEQCVQLFDYQESLTAYITSRMQSIAPNLTQILGPIVSARMLAKAGSLTKLAKLPASTVQILGAEKALFLTLKTKEKRTPKHGLIYSCTLVANSQLSDKGKMSRIAAQNAILAARVDCLSEKLDGEFAKTRIQEGKVQIMSSAERVVRQERKERKLQEYLAAKGGDKAEGDRKQEGPAETDEERRKRKEEKKRAKEEKKAAKSEAKHEEKAELAEAEEKKSSKKEEKKKDKKDKESKKDKKKDE
ncbi:Nucleolar protein NOP5 [Spironucleus salmonicida]|uniref:Nucleolar protein NOP5 n=1 Tax=Spironucleus salmonicida TaxID=348837 RepID=V6LR89_9EUKA|nr:Nucleolar protein NOP5 [Spironucleus salmonicida]KAH0573529.1 Nucleolar protein NOP5 [Spironucleus salmonicida]|eukprot:EST46201.1 Nucleolar protein NOP5 [Spironucleus salmonicida]